MIVVLVGMPGSGKSTVGRQLAKISDKNFFDCDVEIERQLGCSIREYFELHGEASFRDIEQAMLKRLLDSSDDGIVATGGGAVLRLENRALFLNSKNCRVVYLRATVEELLRRLRHDTQRPLLQGVDPAVRLRELFSVRDPLYAQVAHCVVDTGRLSALAIAGVIAGQLREVLSTKCG